MQLSNNAFQIILNCTVLKMLDESASMMSKNDGKDLVPTDKRRKKDMNPWLRDKLEKAEVLSIIEPFWSSLYTQVG